MVKENKVWVKFKNTFKMHTKDGTKEYTIGYHYIPREEYEAYKNIKSIIELVSELDTIKLGLKPGSKEINEIGETQRRADKIQSKKSKTVISETEHS